METKKFKIGIEILIIFSILAIILIGGCIEEKQKEPGKKKTEITKFDMKKFSDVNEFKEYLEKTETETFYTYYNIRIMENRAFLMKAESQYLQYTPERYSETHVQVKGID
ncbi:MAG: hypothetical protein ACK4YO_04000, partial [Candidatus Altarchaeaceae archaeon]